MKYQINGEPKQIKINWALHRRIKLKCIKDGITIKKYVEGLIKADIERKDKI